MFGAKVQQQGSCVWRGLFPVKDRSTLSPSWVFSCTPHRAGSSEKSTPWGSSARCLSVIPNARPTPAAPARSISLPARQQKTDRHSTPRVWAQNIHYQFIPASTSLFPTELAANIQRLNGPDTSTYPIALSLISMMWINIQIHTSSAPRAKGTSHQER